MGGVGFGHRPPQPTSAVVRTTSRYLVMARDRRVLVTTGDGKVLQALEANSFRRRGLGLMFRRRVAQPLVFPRCRAVHGMCVPIPLDIAFYRNGPDDPVVLKVCRLAPMVGVRWSWRASGVIEAAAGTLEAAGILPGSTLAFRDAATPWASAGATQSSRSWRAARGSWLRSSTRAAAPGASDGTPAAPVGVTSGPMSGCGVAGTA